MGRLQKIGAGRLGNKLKGLYRRIVGEVTWRRILRRAKSVTVAFTIQGGGGATMYLDHQLSAAASGDVAVVVRPTRNRPGKYDVSLWNSGHEIARFRTRSLKFVLKAKGIPAKVLVNDLAQWWMFEKDGKVSVESNAGLVGKILALRDRLKATLLCMVHDYYSVCPNFTLVSRVTGLYCNSEADFHHCRDCLVDLSHFSAPCRQGVDICEWRKPFERLYLAADEVRTVSEDVRRRMAACFPSVRFTVVPLKPLTEFKRLPTLSSQGTVVGVFGNIYFEKGSRQVLELVNYLETLSVPDVRIVVVGDIAVEAAMLPSRVKVLGKFQRDDLPAIIEREGINVAYFSSICPETFSYMTHELMALGMPLVCHDLGAPRDAVTTYEKGVVCLSFDVQDVWAALQQARLS